MLLQTDAELEDYKHHTAQWEARVNVAAKLMEQQLAEGNDQINAREDPSRPEYYKNQQVNPAEEYDGMLL